MEQKPIIEVVQGIYLGSRDNSFKTLIIDVLKKANIHNRYIDIITNKKNMKLLDNAFTSSSVNPIDNYEIFEHLGDLSANKFISMYMFKRFPKLNNPRYVKVVARLKINYGSKQSLFEFARRLGFWNFISSSLDFRQKRMKSLLEDVFEAFLGTIEWIIDTETGVIGCGFAIVYQILESLFDDIDISLNYEKLYDAKTRLKELFDLHSKTLGILLYEDDKDEDKNIRISRVYRIRNPVYYVNPVTGKEDKKKMISGEKILLGKGYAPLLKNAHQFAANMAIKELKKMGWDRNIDDIYKEVIEKKTDSLALFVLNDNWENGINELYYVKYKSKYNKKYQCTPINMYCRHLNKVKIQEYLDKGALLTIPDTMGIFPIDYIFIILKYNKPEIKDFLKIVKNHKFTITQTVFDTYVKKMNCLLDGYNYTIN